MRRAQLWIGMSLGGVVTFLVLVLMRAQPLVASAVVYRATGENAAVVEFSLHNRLPASLRVDQALFPIDTTSGVAFDHQPTVTDRYGAERSLVGYRVKPANGMQVTVPVTMTDRTGSIEELRLAYRPGMQLYRLTGRACERASRQE